MCGCAAHPCIHGPTPPHSPTHASYAASDRGVVQQMSGVDAFGQMSGVALKARRRCHVAAALPTRWMQGNAPAPQLQTILSPLCAAAVGCRAPCGAATNSYTRPLCHCCCAHAQVVEQHPDMPGADVAAMYSALLAFSGTGKRSTAGLGWFDGMRAMAAEPAPASAACLVCIGAGWCPCGALVASEALASPAALLPLPAVYPDQLDYVDRVLETCHNVSSLAPPDAAVAPRYLAPPMRAQP